MKKVFTICLILVLIFSNAPSASACWAQPVPFEIFSEDGSRVFVFNPVENSFDNAYAGVYEIVNNERRLIYTVEDLSSFAYESDFRFSADMMHFARIFPPSGMATFEVFSNGVRTRVVMRNDFIRNYAGIEVETSIGPFYTVTWRIENYPPEYNVITISTSEGKNLLFDLETAEFISENVFPGSVDFSGFVTFSGSVIAFVGAIVFFIARRYFASGTV